MRDRELIRIKMLQQVVETLGHEAYLRKEQIEQIARINLPQTILGGTGLLDPLFAHVVGNITEQVPAPVQPDAITLTDRVMDFLRENPAELHDSLGKSNQRICAASFASWMNSNHTYHPTPDSGG